jgi:carbonic anhydrase
MSDVILPPNQLASYYRYIGSLTTPPCSEGVFWTVFESSIEISTNQV